MQNNSILKRIQNTSKKVQEAIAVVGSHAAYIYPERKDELWEGYSYEIPKEEQIRSAFWARLHDPKKLVCELEWDVYEKRGRTVRVTGEIDIVGYSVKNRKKKLPTLLLEIKRVWDLKEWNNKPIEQQNGIIKDIDKLVAICSRIRKCWGMEVFAGVIVVGFTDKKDGIKTIVRDILSKIEIKPINLWIEKDVNSRFGYEWQRNEKKRPIFTCAYLIRVVQ